MSRPKRLPGVSYRGYARYFLTFCVLGRRKRFVDAAFVHAALDQIRRTAGREGFALLAYCFMPDHLHLLVEGVTPQADLPRFVRLAKRWSGFAHARRGGGPLWQEGYYERILREWDEARAVARYILANPVRGGLVDAPEQYPYLGSDVWTLEELLVSCD